MQVKNLRDIVNRLNSSDTIMNIIKSNNPHAFAQWDAKNVTFIGQNLQFSVNNNEMMITYNVSSKDYFIKFFKMENNRRKIINNKSNIKKEDLYKEIESILEKGVK